MFFFDSRVDRGARMSLLGFVIIIENDNEMEEKTGKKEKTHKQARVCAINFFIFPDPHV